MPKKKQRFSKGHENELKWYGPKGKPRRKLEIPWDKSINVDFVTDEQGGTAAHVDYDKRAPRIRSATSKLGLLGRDRMPSGMGGARREDMRRKRDKANTEVDSSPLNKRKPNPLSAISDAFSRYLPKHKKKKK